MPVTIKLAFKGTGIKHADILTLLYRLFLVKEIPRIVTWLCFLHQAKERNLLGLVHQT
jgi:hypothetical protein